MILSFYDGLMTEFAKTGTTEYNQQKMSGWSCTAVGSCLLWHISCACGHFGINLRYEFKVG